MSSRKSAADAESWHLVVDTTTKKILTYNPATQPDVKRHVGEAQRYEELGILRKREDAEQFRQYKEIGLLPDAVAYLSCEHATKSALQAGATVQFESLAQMVSSVKKETGRKCFGSCMSLEGAPACAICFSSLNKTWSLCACVKCLFPEEQAAYFSKQQATNTLSE